MSGLVENLPDELSIDITDLGIGKSIFVGDLHYDNLTLLTPATTAICAVSRNSCVARCRCGRRGFEITDFKITCFEISCYGVG
ncbi:MAG: hypothetical protein L6V35_06280 [Alistipes putredinis]|nr:MAG: hypothetical protein L6V35_06280 [Alistipes putredinis]